MQDPTWRKPPAGLVERFGAVIAARPELARKSMFGCPCGFVNGHLCCGVFQEHVFVRIGARAAVDLIAAQRAEPFMPMRGRTMREYVVIPAADALDSQALLGWIDQSLVFTRALPPKAGKPARRKSRIIGPGEA